MRIVGIIQARIGSKRLPNKMMLSLHGHPIIEWVVHRASKAKLLDDVLVAIPETSDNDILFYFIAELGIKVFRGPENDVLKRFFLSAQFSEATHIVRICADNPLVSGREIDHLVDFYFKNPCDYAYNHVPENNTYPDGLGAEIISFSILEKLESLAVDPFYREHCLSFITDHPEQFDIKTFNPPNPLIACPWLKFDIDTFEDYKRLALKKYSMDVSLIDLVRIFK